MTKFEKGTKGYHAYMIRRIKKERENGLKAKAIAEKLGMTDNGVYYWFAVIRAEDTAKGNKKSNQATLSQNGSQDKTPSADDESLTEESEGVKEEKAEEDNEKPILLKTLSVKATALIESEDSETKETEVHAIDTPVSKNSEEKPSVFSKQVKEMQDSVKLARTHYLVDTENVSGCVIEKMVGALPEDAMVHCFFTPNSTKLPFGAIRALIEKQNQIRFIRAFCGEKNSLDFQIISALGLFLGVNDGKKREFYLVTNDKGFDAAIEFWKLQGITVGRFDSNTVQTSLGVSEPVVQTTAASAKAKKQTAETSVPAVAVAAPTQPAFPSLTTIDQVDVALNTISLSNWDEKSLIQACKIVAKAANQPSCSKKLKKVKSGAPSYIGGAIREYGLTIQKPGKLGPHVFQNPEYTLDSLVKAGVKPETAEIFVAQMPRRKVLERILLTYKK